MGDWKLTAAQAKKLRDYLLRGGFLMLDDFWGYREWDRFMESMRMVFPDRPIVDIDNADSDFPHRFTISTTAIRFPASGPSGAARRIATPAARRRTGAASTTTSSRLMVAMDFNSDVGDSWEWADDPEYPEKYSALGIRIGVNYVMYRSHALKARTAFQRRLNFFIL